MPTKECLSCNGEADKIVYGCEIIERRLEGPRVRLTSNAFLQDEEHAAKDEGGDEYNNLMSHQSSAGESLHISLMRFCERHGLEREWAQEGWIGRRE